MLYIRFMAKIILSIRSSTGHYLRGSEIKQLRYPGIQVISDDGRQLLGVALTFEQLAQMLVGSMETDCTLEYAHGEKPDEVVPPPSLSQRATQVFGDIQSDMLGRMQAAHDRVYDLLNSGKSAGKTALNEVLHDLRVIRDNFKSNQGYMLNRMQEDVERMRDSVVAQLRAMPQIEANPDLTDILPLALTNPEAKPKSEAVPVPKSDYTKVEKPISEMTVMEVAENLNFELHRIEPLCQTQLGEKTTLFMASAWASGNFIGVKYISYQGEWSLTLDTGRKYLSILRMVQKASEFVRHCNIPGLDKSAARSRAV